MQLRKKTKYRHLLLGYRLVSLLQRIQDISGKKKNSLLLSTTINILEIAKIKALFLISLQPLYHKDLFVVFTASSYHFHYTIAHGNTRVILLCYSFNKTLQ